MQFSPTAVADFADLLGDVVKIVGVSDDLEAVARCEADVRREIGNQVSASRSQPYYLDVTHPQANKGNVVRRLSEMSGIPNSGDCHDRRWAKRCLMFAASGLSIAMGNASPDVQRTARRITTSNEQEGFARAVECFILNEQPAPIIAGADSSKDKLKRRTITMSNTNPISPGAIAKTRHSFEALAEAAMETIQDGFVVGLGSGHTVAAVFERLGRGVRDGLRVRGCRPRRIRHAWRPAWASPCSLWTRSRSLT